MTLFGLSPQGGLSPFAGGAPIGPNVTPMEASASVLQLKGKLPEPIFQALSLNEQFMRGSLQTPNTWDRIQSYAKMLLPPRLEDLAQGAAMNPLQQQPRGLGPLLGGLI